MEQSQANLHSIDSKIYEGATKGDLLKHFTLDECLGNKTPGGDNALHIAARFGHCGIIREALNGLHQLLFDLNYKGQTLLHIAADNGHFQVVELFQESSCAAADVENGDRDRSERLRDWRVKVDNKGDTTLHKALRNRHERVALLLLELDVDLAAVVNHGRESPLYLAAECRCDLVLQKILKLGNDDYSVSGPFGQSPLHAAAKVSHFTTKCLVERRSDLIDQADNSSKTAAHYAVGIERRHGDILKQLLKHKPEVTCLYDCDGFTPLHRAAMAGSIYAVEVILSFCPQSIEFRDQKDGKTVLHLARNNYSFPRFLDNKHIIHMINEPDNNGNTPLHLAIMESEQTKVYALLRNDRVCCKIMNNNQQTAMDLRRVTDEQNSSSKNMIRLALDTHERAWCSEARTCPPRQLKISIVEEQFKQVKEEDLKDTMNNMALIAALVATITFTAAFTVPGGYDNSKGNVILIKKAAFQVFYLSNIVAMLLSLYIMMSYNYNFVVSGGQDPHKTASRMAIKVVVCIALTAVSFLSGVFVVAFDDAIWIVILGCIVGLYYFVRPILMGCCFWIHEHTSLDQVASVARDGIHGAACGWGYFSRKWLKWII